ncbi:MAG: SPFH domain-containing protein [Oscillospiraceae bacterium]|nr:SPFH domain-containing protein [Oscillospiraceae bacterium]
MGIIKAVTSAAGGALADQWVEVIEAETVPNMIATGGIAVRKNDKRGQNKKGTQDLISDGSVIHVGENMFMLLVDGGKVIDYSAEAGYYEVKTGSAPSLFNGQFRESLSEAFGRIRFGGVASSKQDVRFINLSEIRDISFGTPNPLNYFDCFYNAELYLRAHGYYSMRIVNPLKFYAEVARDKRIMVTDDLRRAFQSEFLTALQSAIGKMSVDGVRISHVGSRSAELAKYMSTALDESWENLRGVKIETVGISSISYDEESKKLINMRNTGAMLSDPTIREGYTQGAVARGIEAAGSNSAGSMAGFMGVGMGMQAGGGFMAAASASNMQQAQMQQQQQAQMQQQQAQAAAQAAAPAPGGWQCECGNTATGNFCAECGGKRPERTSGGFCQECGSKLNAGAKFCAECGNKL